MPRNQFLAHGENADLDVGARGVTEELVGPFDVIEREGDLLNGLKAHDLGNLLLFDRRQLDEAGERLLPADAHSGDATLDRVPLNEVCQRALNERFAIIAGAGEDGFRVR